MSNFQDYLAYQEKYFGRRVWDADTLHEETVVDTYLIVQEIRNNGCIAVGGSSWESLSAEHAITDKAVPKGPDGDMYVQDYMQRQKANNRSRMQRKLKKEEKGK